MTVGSVMAALEKIAPARYAFEWDRIGLQVGDAYSPIEKIAVSLDPTHGAIEFAVERGCQMLVSHHPSIWNPLKSVGFGSEVASMIRNNLAFAAAHTNWDCAPGGVNDALIAALGLRPVGVFGSAAHVRMLKMVAFAPESATEDLIQAASQSGAGQIGAYTRCAFASAGWGTFLGGEDANPAVGEKGRIERAPEVRLEMILPEALREWVEHAVRAVHPYEEPALDFFALTDDFPAPAGRLGELLEPMELSAFTHLVIERLGSPCLAWGSGTVKTVGVVGGAASDEWRSAKTAGADVFITGEVKHSDAAFSNSFPIVQAGHYATEQPGVVELGRRLASSGFVVEIFEPPKGDWGRPQ